MIDRIRARVHWHEALAIVAGLFLMLRQAWLLDDAFIYFRYADNLLFLGRGLVYNQGEWVEGYSSPLWMLFCIAARLTHLDWWWIVRLAGAFSWLAFALLLCRSERAWRRDDSPSFNAPLLYLAFCYPALCYFTSGLESPLVQIAAVTAALAILEPDRRRWQIVAGSWILIRHELALAWLILFAFQCTHSRRIPWTLIASTSALVGGWLLARVWLYAELLPNTFYLKHTNLPHQGWLYLEQLLWTQALPLWLLGALFLLWFGRRRGILAEARWLERATLLAMALSCGAYVIRVGGDMLYYRLLAFPFLMIWSAMGGIVGPWIARGSGRPWKYALAGLAIAGGAFVAVPPQLDRNPHFGIANRDHKLPVLVDGVNDANSHRKHPDLAFSPWMLGAALEQRPLYSSYLADHPDGGHERIEVQGWCAQGFREFDVRIVQRWGLTEPFLARLQMPWERVAHKFTLIAHAQVVADLRAGAIERGSSPKLSEIAASGIRVPAWVDQNPRTIQLIDDKMYNRHDLSENLRLSLQFAKNYPARR